MKEGTQLENTHRKAIMEQLAGYNAGTVYQKAREKYRTARNAYENLLCNDVVRDQGADKLAADVLNLESQLEQAKLTLKNAGFELDRDGNVDILQNGKVGSLIRKVEAAVLKDFGTEDTFVEPLFQAARIKLLLATTVEEAKKIVEPLLNFEVKV